MPIFHGHLCCTLRMPTYYAFNTMHTPNHFTRRKDYQVNNAHFY